MTPIQLKEILDQHQLWLDSDGEQGRRANFRVAHLSRADLIGADLTGAVLRGADLYEADLREATLTGANLREANLYRADLREADFRGANLREANLWEANLTGAQLGPEIRKCYCFSQATVSEDQLAWLCLHPRFGEWVSGLEIVN